MNFYQLLEAPSQFRGLGTDFVCESVYGFWGRSRDFVVRGYDDLCASRSAIFFRPKRRELYHIRVEIHNKSLEPV